MTSRFEQRSYAAEDSLWQPVVRTREMVEGYPVSSTLIAFGLGLGVGVAIASLLGSAEHEERTSEKLARQLAAAMARILPENVVRAMHG
jgi:histidine ammonia-lyase